MMTPRHALHATLDGHLDLCPQIRGPRPGRSQAAVPGDRLQRDRSACSRQVDRQLCRWRIWFLYEWLIGARLDLPDAPGGRYVPVVDLGARSGRNEGENSPRHRVKNNLPGTPAFCPLVFRTQTLDRFIGLSLPERAREAESAGRAARPWPARRHSFC